MAFPVVFTKQLGAASSNSIAHSQSPGTSALTLTSAIVTIDTATAANVAIGRRVIITSGGDDSGITFAAVGTNSTGNAISDTFAGSNGGTAQSNLDFVTVKSITPSAAIASTVTAGTNGVGSSPWFVPNWNLTPFSLSYAIEIVSGAANFTIQHTYDDPNNLLGGNLFPFPFNGSVANASATIDGAYTSPITAIRVLLNSGTGEVRVRYIQAGIG